MDSSKNTSLFDVYLRLRPSTATDRERFLDVEQPDQTHITIHPPINDNRKRAIERFAFTKVFEEHSGQRELFEASGIRRPLAKSLSANLVSSPSFPRLPLASSPLSPAESR